MADSEIRKKKRRKNLTILGLIFLWCAVIWLVTMIRIANADTLRGAYHDDRAAYLEKSEDTPHQWRDAYEEKSEQRLNADEQRDEERAARLEGTIETSQDWEEQYEEKSPERLEAQELTDEARERHLEKITARPQEWHEGWTARQEAKEEAEWQERDGNAGNK